MPQERERRPSAGEDTSRLRAAVRAHWRLLLVLGVVGAAAGAGAGALRSPVFTAETEFSIGRADLVTQTQPGYAQAVQNLTGVYSRLALASNVVVPVAESRGTTAAAIRGRTAAAPVPESGIFRLASSGASARDAIALNRETAGSVRRYVTSLVNDGEDSSQRDIGKYRRASARALEAQRRLSRLTARRDRDSGSVSTERLREARVDARSAELVAQGFAQRFTENFAPQAQGFRGVEVISAPRTAASDRGAWMQGLGAAGLVGGLLVALALGLVLDGRVRRRTGRTARGS